MSLPAAEVPGAALAPVPSAELPVDELVLPVTGADGVKTGVDICANAPKATNAIPPLINRLTKFMGDAKPVRKLVGVMSKPGTGRLTECR